MNESIAEQLKKLGLVKSDGGILNPNSDNPKKKDMCPNTVDIEEMIERNKRDIKG